MGINIFCNSEDGVRKKKFFMVLLTVTSEKVDYAIFHLKEKQHLNLQSDFSEVIL